MSVIFSAIESGDLAEVTRLLDESPRLGRQANSQGTTPLLFALYRGQQAIASLLQENARPLSIYEAAAIGDTECVREHLDTDPSLANAASPDGFTALQLAAFFNRSEAVDLLLALGADPDLATPNPFGVRAIHAACASRNVEIVRRLLEAGADVSVAQEKGFTPLHEAAGSGNTELALLLLEAGADPHARSETGEDAAATARAHGFDQLAQILVQKSRDGADFTEPR